MILFRLREGAPLTNGNLCGNNRAGGWRESAHAPMVLYYVALYRGVSTSFQLKQAYPLDIIKKRFFTMKLVNSRSRISKICIKPNPKMKKKYDCSLLFVLLFNLIILIYEISYSKDL